MATTVKNVKKDKSIAVCNTFKNKIRALTRHVKNFPDDTQGAARLVALKSLGTLQKPREKPKSPKWSQDAIRYATLKGLADIGQTPEDIRLAEMLKQKKEKLISEGINQGINHVTTNKDTGRSKPKAKPKQQKSK